MTRKDLMKFAGALCAALIVNTMTSPPVRADDLLIPKGTVVPVALIQDVSTATAKVGDKIKAVYTGDDEGGFPTGTVFVATVSEASPKSGKSSGMIKATFDQAILPNKKKVSIQGKTVNGKPSSGGSDQSKKKTGKGAAIGAGAGMLVAGNNVAGAMLGGAAGAYAGKKKGSKPQDITFKKGTPFGIELQAQTHVPQ